MSAGENMELQAFVALQDLRAAGESGCAAGRIPASRIVAYARRGDSTVDLALERALRHELGLRRLYAKALGGIAIASSPRAAAASEARVTRRSIGAHSLEIVSEADGIPWLVIRLAEGSAPVSMIELRRPDGTGRRLDLGAAIDGVVQLPLDPAFPEIAGVADLIGDPATEIYLL